MSSAIVQETRKAEALRDAAAAFRNEGMPTPRSDEAEMEPMLSDENKLAALLGDACENLVRLATAQNHTIEHVIPSQDKEIARLKESVEKPRATRGERGGEGGTAEK